MSGRLMGKVFELQLNRPQQAVALALADHGHDDGSGIFPGNAYLAWKTGFSERHVIRVLQQLEWLKLLEPVGRPGGGRGRRQEYHMRVANVAKKAAFRSGGETPQADAANGEAANGDAASPRKGDRKSGDNGAKADAGGGSTVTARPDNGDTAAQPHKDAGAPGTVRESYGGTVSTACEDGPDRDGTDGATRGGHEVPSVRFARGGGMQGQGQMFDAVCAVCRRDPAVISWRSRQDLLRLARQLEQAGYGPADIARFGERWYGRTAPTPRQLQDSIGAVLSAREKDHGTASERTRAEQRDADNSEIERIIRAAVIGEADAAGRTDSGRGPAYGETSGGQSYVIETILCDFVPGDG